MKKVMILFVVLLIAISFSAVKFESQAVFVIEDLYEGGGGSSDTVAPTITYSVQKDEFLIGEEDFVYPQCTATDNISTNISCQFSTSMINFNVPGTYSLKIYAYDYSGNYTFEYVDITMLPSGTYYETLYRDDHDFQSKMDVTTVAKVGFDPSVSALYCYMLGYPYEKIGTTKKGEYLYDKAWKIGDPMYDYSSNGLFYDYIFHVFTPKYKVYRIYDLCQKKATFDKTLSLSALFDGMAMWTRNDTVSIPQKSTTYTTYHVDPYSLYSYTTSVTFYDYTAMELYITHSTLEYVEDIIDEYGIVEFLDSAEQFLENPYVNWGAKLAIGGLVFLIAPHTTIAATVKAALASFAVSQFLDFIQILTVDAWIDDIYDENYIGNAIDDAIANNHGLRITSRVDGVFIPFVGMPVELVFTPWNQNQPIERVLNDQEFGTFTFVSEKTLFDMYANQ